MIILNKWQFIFLQSAFHDGKQPNWFHKACFFKKHRPQSEVLIDGFSKLRAEDQKDIKEELGKNIFILPKQWSLLMEWNPNNIRVIVYHEIIWTKIQYWMSLSDE